MADVMKKYRGNRVTQTKQSAILGYRIATSILKKGKGGFAAF